MAFQKDTDYSFFIGYRKWVFPALLIQICLRLAQKPDPDWPNPEVACSSQARGTSISPLFSRYKRRIIGKLGTRNAWPIRCPTRDYGTLTPVRVDGALMIRFIFFSVLGFVQVRI